MISLGHFLYLCIILQGIEVAEQRIVCCGKVWSSGGVTSGLDLILAFINDISGKKEAGQVQLLLEYFPPATHFVDLDQITDLPPITSPEGVNEEGRMDLPKYVMDEYFK